MTTTENAIISYYCTNPNFNSVLARVNFAVEHLHRTSDYLTIMRNLTESLSPEADGFVVLKSDVDGRSLAENWQVRLTPAKVLGIKEKEDYYHFSGQLQGSVIPAGCNPIYQSYIHARLPEMHSSPSDINGHVVVIQVPLGGNISVIDDLLRDLLSYQLKRLAPKERDFDPKIHNLFKRWLG